MLRPATACLGFEDFWEILGNSAAQAESVRYCGKSAKRSLGSQLRWGGVSGNHKVGMNNVRLMESSDLALVCIYCLGRGRTQQRNNGTYQHFWTDSCESYPNPCPSNPCPEASQFSYSLYVPGAVWAAALLWNAEWVILWAVSLCLGPLRSVASLFLAACCLSQSQSALVFIDVMGTYLPDPGVLGWVA